MPDRFLNLVRILSEAELPRPTWRPIPNFGLLPGVADMSFCLICCKGNVMAGRQAVLGCYIHQVLCHVFTDTVKYAN